MWVAEPSIEPNVVNVVVVSWLVADVVGTPSADIVLSTLEDHRERTTGHMFAIEESGSWWSSP